MKKLLSTLIIAIFMMFSMSANANSAVAKAGKAIGGGAGLALNFAVDQLLNGIGWVMDEGTRSKKIPDTPTSSSGGSSSGDSGSSTGTGTTTVPNPFHVDGEGGESGGIPSDAQTYPFEYWFDGQKFSSAESACSYAFGSYLSKKGLKKSRRQDGTYLEKTNIYIGSSGYFHSSVPGYFTCNTHAAAIDSSSCGQSNVCGSHYSWSGSMLYAGTEKTTTTTVSDDYKERREKARQAVEQAIANAQAQVNAQSGTGATTAPTDATDNPPRTGTTTGTGVGDLANPVHVDTNTNTTTGDTTTNTNTNTNTTTTTNTHTNTKTETKSFEMPTFCGWAQTVCDFVDWFKAEPPQEQEPKKVPKADLSDLGLSNDELFKQRIQFDGQCPKHELRFSVNGHNLIKPIPTYHFCNLLEQLAPWLLAFSYLSSGFFVVRNL